MSSKARTIVATPTAKKGAAQTKSFHVINGISATKPSESLKTQRIVETTRRSSLTSSTASSRAKELATKSTKSPLTQKAVVAKVITAASLKSAQQKKISPTATADPKPSIPDNSTPTRKIQVKRPLEDDDDDIYAYYAKKQKRMEELKSASKAPTLSNPRKDVTVAKPVDSAPKTIPKPSIKALGPAAKKKASIEAVKATSKLNPGSKTLASQ